LNYIQILNTRLDIRRMETDNLNQGEDYVRGKSIE